MSNRMLIHSYPLGKYFVSTIYRRSSAAFYPSMYYETLVWEWDSAKQECGKLVDVNYRETRYRAAALVEHARICALLCEREPEFQMTDEDEGP